MLDFLYNQLTTNQFLIAAIGGGALVALRNIPNKIWSVVYRNISTTLEVDVTSKAYKNIVAFTVDLQINFFSRNFSIQNVYKKRAWEEDEKSANWKLTMGYGDSLFMYKGVFGKLTRIRNKEAAVDANRESIEVRLFSRRIGLLNEFISDANASQETDNMLSVYRSSSDYFGEGISVSRRLPETVITENNILDKLISDIDTFLKNEDHYTKHGINYKFGMLLSGQPGTGKSSIIRAIATHFNFPVYYIDRITPMTNFSALASQAIGGLLVMEEVDTYNLARRKLDIPKNKTGVKRTSRGLEFKIADLTRGLEFKDDEESESGFVNPLTEVLNVMDGALTPHGLIFIMTTNKVSALDPALIRKGRIDRHYEINEIKHDSIIKLLALLYSLSEDDIRSRLGSTVLLPNNGANIQDLFFSGCSIDETLKKLSKKNELRKNHH